MTFTQDELVVLIESLREFRLRVLNSPRQLLADALMFRLAKELVEAERVAYLNSEEAVRRAV